MSLKFVAQGSTNNISALAQIMAWRRPGDKPLSEPVMIRLQTHTCVTRPHRVKTHLNLKSHKIWFAQFLFFAEFPNRFTGLHGARQYHGYSLIWLLMTIENRSTTIINADIMLGNSDGCVEYFHGCPGVDASQCEWSICQGKHYNGVLAAESSHQQRFRIDSFSRRRSYLMISEFLNNGRCLPFD